MRRVLESLPSQVAEAAEIAARIKLRAEARAAKVVICGLGGSAIGGDVVRSAMRQRLTVPVLSHRDYGIPQFVDTSTLVVASSYSGNTEETLSSYRSAVRTGATVACISSGGALSERAISDGVPLVRIPAGLPPRAAIGFSAVALTGILHACGLISDPREDVNETVRLTQDLVRRYASEVPCESNPAKKIALALHGKLVAIYAASGLLEAAALRWRGQIEENAKNLAFHHLLPEMNHNELVGWKLPSASLRLVGVVLLRDREDHAQVQKRFDLTREILEGAAGVVLPVWSEGSSPLARVFSLICLGDFVSLYLALLNGVDPTPVEVIEGLKKRLSS